MALIVQTTEPLITTTTPTPTGSEEKQEYLLDNTGEHTEKLFVPEDPMLSNIAAKTKVLLRADSLFLETSGKIIELSEAHSVANKLMQKYACPATPESDADHNVCVPAAASLDTKQAEVLHHTS